MNHKCLVTILFSINRNKKPFKNSAWLRNTSYLIWFASNCKSTTGSWKLTTFPTLPKHPPYSNNLDWASLNIFTLTPPTLVSKERSACINLSPVKLTEWNCAGKHKFPNSACWTGNYFPGLLTKHGAGINQARNLRLPTSLSSSPTYWRDSVYWTKSWKIQSKES